MNFVAYLSMGKKYSVPQLEKNMLVNFSDLKKSIFQLNYIHRVFANRKI